MKKNENMHTKFDQYVSQINSLSATQQKLLALRLGIDVQDDQADNQLAAYVTIKQKDMVSEGELRKYITKKLPIHMNPAQISIIEKMPHTYNGKVDYQALSNLKKRSRIHNVIEPNNDVQSVLKGIWESLLNLNQISTSDNFFNIGGHSLLVTSMVAQIRDIFPVQLSLNNVFDNPTIIELANYMLSDIEGKGEIERTAELYLQLSEMSEDELNIKLDEGN